MGARGVSISINTTQNPGFQATNMISRFKHHVSKQNTDEGDGGSQTVPVCDRLGFPGKWMGRWILKGGVDGILAAFGDVGFGRDGEGW